MSPTSGWPSSYHTFLALYPCVLKILLIGPLPSSKWLFINPSNLGLLSGSILPAATFSYCSYWNSMIFIYTGVFIDVHHFWCCECIYAHAHIQCWFHSILFDVSKWFWDGLKVPWHIKDLALHWCVNNPLAVSIKIGRFHAKHMGMVVIEIIFARWFVYIPGDSFTMNLVVVIHRQCCSSGLIINLLIFFFMWGKRTCVFDFSIW